ncbi:MAG TPA: ABC transporter ATP-binding protein, partial [Savagea sp.]
MIQLDNVHVALKGFDLTIDELHIPKGFTVGCIGRNGAGKSTLIRTMMGLTVPARGDVLWDGAPLDVAMKERIGFVYDDLYYPKEFKVKALRRLFRSVYPTWNDSLYTELLESYGVSEKKKIKQLSKGMKMKTQIALALAHDPDVLIMDEPTAGLDPVVRRQFVATLRDWMDAREDRTLFFSTHITSDLERFADYILLVDDGRVKFFLPIDEVEERFVLVRGTTNTLS